MAISRCIHKPWMLLHCWIATGHSPGFHIWFWSWGDILFIILFGFVGTLGLVILQFCVAGYLVRDDWRHWFANLNLDSDHFNNQLEKRGQYCYLGQSCLIQLCILTSTEFAGWWSSKPCYEMGRINWRALDWINKPYNFNSGTGNWVSFCGTLSTFRQGVTTGSTFTNFDVAYWPEGLKLKFACGPVYLSLIRKGWPIADGFCYISVIIFWLLNFYVVPWL